VTGIKSLAGDVMMLEDPIINSGASSHLLLLWQLGGDDLVGGTDVTIKFQQRVSVDPLEREMQCEILFV
jgi:hypothetical protein